MRIYGVVLVIALSSLTATCSLAAGSVHGVVKFTGSIVDAPCSISPDTADQTVNLGTVSDEQLKRGGTSTPKKFYIKLDNCDVVGLPEKVTTTFHSNHAGRSHKRLLELDRNGSARGVWIGLIDDNDTPVLFDTPSSLQILNMVDNTIVFSAYLQADSSNPEGVTTGDFTSTVNFEIAYN